MKECMGKKKKTFTSEYLRKQKKLIITLPLLNGQGEEVVLYINNVGFEEVGKIEKYLIEGIQ